MRHAPDGAWEEIQKWKGYPGQTFPIQCGIGLRTWPERRRTRNPPGQCGHWTPPMPRLGDLANPCLPRGILSGTTALHIDHSQLSVMPADAAPSAVRPGMYPCHSALTLSLHAS